MKIKKILETERLVLRELTTNDAEFILKLLNTPTWLEFIGDKKVHTIEDAENYLETGPIDSYRKNGFGLWLILLKEDSTPIGICGLINRESLDDIDIGFALLPEYEKLGYGFEIAYATMNYAKNVLGINKIVAITDPKNIASIKLLDKIGFQFEKTFRVAEHDTVLLFSPLNAKRDRKEIDRLTTKFYGLFTNTNDLIANVKGIEDIFIANGTLINNSEKIPAVYDLTKFIEPREKILTDGTLTNFIEREIFEKTEIFENIAQRFSLYEKSGNLNGEIFETKGMKTIQFVKINKEWKMSSLAWCDEK